MRLTSEQVEQTLHQFDAQPIPDDHPVVAQLSDLFGDHTFFLDSHGLNVVEPIEPEAETAAVINIADWSDEDLTRLAPHPPQPTDVVVVLGRTH